MNNIHNVPSASLRMAALGKTFELSVAVNEDMEQGLRHIGLTRARATVIMALVEHGPVHQRVLSERLRVTPRNVTALVDALEEKQLVERKPSPNDRRASIVDLTEKGREIGLRLAADGATLADTLFADVPAADIAAFVRTIEHVIATLRSSTAR